MFKYFKYCKNIKISTYLCTLDMLNKNNNSFNTVYL